MTEHITHKQEMVPQRTMIAHHHPSRGLSLGSLVRAAMATTSIATHEARIAHSIDRRMQMTIDELRALPGGIADIGPDERRFAVMEQPDTNHQDAKRARRAARLGDVPVIINRRPVAPVKPKRARRAKTTTA